MKVFAWRQRRCHRCRRHQGYDNTLTSSSKTAELKMLFCKTYFFDWSKCKCWQQVHVCPALTEVLAVEAFCCPLIAYNTNINKLLKPIEETANFMSAKLHKMFCPRYVRFRIQALEGKQWRGDGSCWAASSGSTLLVNQTIFISSTLTLWVYSK